ncbi:multidrug effflux MFS transporter [Selenomonas sp. TAMA-11512]|uniref:multidrug effflux MFS transporter n=1 Tax=Selenomonas sp. TAMA-11512 TaxID=3095337 RepID=UPI00308840A2|nr:multidrug effflux MFS transporter [Selenomonas sp. TAMA-11512]
MQESKETDIELKCGQAPTTWIIVYLGMLSAMAPWATDMYLPALPLVGESFGVPAAMAQLSLGMTMVGIAVGMLFSGPFIDCYGRQRPVVLGMLGFGLASLLCAWTENIYVFLFFRLVQGIAGAFGITGARAIARDMAEGAHLTRLFALLMLVNGLAPIVAPVMGGQMLVYSDWRSIFYLLLGIGILLDLTSAFYYRETLTKENRINNIWASFQSYKELLKDRYFIGNSLVQSFFFAAFFAYISGSTFVFQKIYGLSPQEFSYLFAFIGILVMIAGVLPASLAGRIKDESMLRWSLWQAAIGGFLFLLAIYFHLSFLPVALALFVSLPTISVMGAASFSLAMQANGKRAGSAAALIGFFSNVAGGFMTPLVGIRGEQDAMPMAIIMFAGEGLALISFYWFIYGKTGKVK